MNVSVYWEPNVYAQQTSFSMLSDQHWVEVSDCLLVVPVPVREKGEFPYQQYIAASHLKVNLLFVSILYQSNGMKRGIHL